MSETTQGGTTRVAVVGANGRMGQQACQAVEAADDLELVGRYGRGDDLGDLGGAQVVVDLTVPDSSPGVVAHCVERDVHVVVGTTGWDDARLGALRQQLADHPHVGVLIAPNFAIGAILMMRFAAQAAQHLPRAEIVELHHEAKLDAPSGTARATAEAMPGDVPIHSVRLPGLVAHQEVLLGGEGQLLTIRHDTLSREAFVPGVLLALERLAGLPAGVTMGLESLLE